ncbi:MAG TPA: sodium-translocating pyrophosphatase [Treponemataceae bacterium]|nr:sodium-translocating pyrophosphatase [Treponemataceae bacterium]
MVVIPIIAIILALSYAAHNFRTVKKMDPGTDKMKEIALAIQEGANAFMAHEYKIIFFIALIITAVLVAVVSLSTGIAFLLGAFMSASAGLIGMKIATISNVRVSNTAKNSKSLGASLKVAFRGGSVMGLCVGGFSLFGLIIIYIVFGKILGQAHPNQLIIVSNHLGIHFIPFTMTVSGYALGCSVIAMFNRVGGGIYTKAADMGADLVGKTEAGIPEDDPRNPATIADNVGDNVGDVAGLGSDLLESFVGAIISSIVLAAYMYYTNVSSATPIDASLVEKLIFFPIIFASVGLLSSIVGIGSLLIRKVSDHPHKELNISTIISATLTIVLNAFVTWYFFKDANLDSAGFSVGALSPWFAATLGIMSGIIIGQIAEYFTSYDYKPTQNVSAASKEGAALNITEGLGSGMKSVFLPVVVLSIVIIGSHAIAGLYGVAMAAIGMLSFIASTVSVDTYGPIADNAGGISEMAHLDPGVRKITDELDAVGNTTAAIGKGFAIGSAALAALSLFASYLYAQADPGETMGLSLVLNMINTLTLAGALVGAALPYLFSGILIEAVANAARQMVQEVRRQFKADPGILTGKSRPDYAECIRISSTGALKEMKLPALLAVLTPLVCGFLFGAEFVGGLLIGTTLSAIMLALFTANAGGSWDNSKKYIENGHHGGKGSEAHAASIVGDTVGDPLKDTVGPSLDILIKIMSVISLIAVSIFVKYNFLAIF